MLKIILLTAALLWPLFSVAAPVNVNIADAREIQKHLDGIGPVLSRRIVDYRREHGAFSSPADLDRVKGIGARTLAKNAVNLRVR